MLEPPSCIAYTQPSNQIVLDLRHIVHFGGRNDVSPMNAAFGVFVDNITILALLVRQQMTNLQES